jgi:hypothetical protein
MGVTKPSVTGISRLRHPFVTDGSHLSHLIVSKDTLSAIGMCLIGKENAIFSDVVTADSHLCRTNLELSLLRNRFTRH